MNEGAQKHPDGILGSALGAFFPSAPHHGGWSALGVLLVGLLLSTIAARYTRMEADQEARAAFDIACKDIQSKIENRLESQEQILRAGAALFAADNGITREEWHEFAERQKISRKFPGIQGFGYAKWLPREQLEQHIQEMRKAGFPGYRVWPEGSSGACSPVTYLEPINDRNLRSIGYDMFSEPVRRAAMERAHDNDDAALSDKVTLVQEDGKDVQAGALMYVPVYRGEPPETVPERRTALIGWVYSPYRMNDLMDGILGGWNADHKRQICLEVFDGKTADPAALLYGRQCPACEKERIPIYLEKQKLLEAGGHQWLLSFSLGGEGNYADV